MYLYIKIRGLAISDFFMVTNKSLQQFRDLVSGSMTQLWEELRRQKDEFLKRIGTVGEQQQAMMAQQTQMDEKLQCVSENVQCVSEKVEEIRDISDSIETRVGQMDHSINIMSAGVQRANEGIYLLCAAVADVTRRVGMDNSSLKMYVKSTPEIADGNPGLRTLLEGMSGSGDQSAVSVLSGCSSVVSSTGVITEVPEEEVVVTASPESVGGEVQRGRSGTGGNSTSKTASITSGLQSVLYRRNSSASLPARVGGGSGGIMASLWTSQSANFAGLGGLTSRVRSQEVASGQS